MTARYIRAEDLMNNNPVGLSFDTMAQWAEYIAELPDADVRKNIHGKWVRHQQSAEYITYECSECGAHIHQAKTVTRMPNFCNRCGSDMMEKKDCMEDSYITRETAIAIIAESETLKEAGEKIQMIPSMQIVRCKDCDNWKANGKYGAKGRGACEEFSDAEDGMTRYTGENDYCSYGERNDG